MGHGVGCGTATVNAKVEISVACSTMFHVVFPTLDPCIFLWQNYFTKGSHSQKVNALLSWEAQLRTAVKALACHIDLGLKVHSPAPMVCPWCAHGVPIVCHGYQKANCAASKSKVGTALTEKNALKILCTTIRAELKD